MFEGGWSAVREKVAMSALADPDGCVFFLVEDDPHLFTCLGHHSELPPLHTCRFGPRPWKGGKCKKGVVEEPLPAKGLRKKHSKDDGDGDGRAPAKAKPARASKTAAPEGPPAMPSKEDVAKAFSPAALEARQKQLEKEYEGRTVADLFDMDFEQLAETAQGILEGKYGDFEVKNVDASKAGKDRVLIEGEVYGKNGQRVGEFSRYLLRNADGSFSAQHEVLKLDPKTQGQGFAEQLNAKLFGWYRGSRIKDASLHANIDVGPYAWARAGWGFKAKKDATKVAGWLRETAEKFPDEEQAKAARDMADRLENEDFDADTFPTAYEISQLGRKPGQGKRDSWIGKDALLGDPKDEHQYDAVMQFEYP